MSWSKPRWPPEREPPADVLSRGHALTQALLSRQRVFQKASNKGGLGEEMLVKSKSVQHPTKNGLGERGVFARTKKTHGDRLERASRCAIGT